MRSKPLCVLVDNEEMSLSSLQEKIEELGLLEIEKAFLDPDKFLVEVEKLESTIIFLDIEMSISGFDVAKKLKDKLVIIVSGHTDRGTEAFDINAIDFVTKPIKLNKLKSSIERALNLFQPSVVVIKTQETKREEIRCNTICYIKTAHDSRDKEIILSNGKSIIAKNIGFKDLSAILPNSFLQVNPQEMVNLDYVNKLLNSDTLGIDISSMAKTIEINLGISYRETFFKHKPNFK